MAKSKSTFEKMQREKAKRDKKKAKKAKKENREKEDHLDIEDMTPEELFKLHSENNDDINNPFESKSNR